MPVLSMEHIHKDLVALKRDVLVIKHILSEEGELTDEAKKRLKEARETPKENYIELE